MSNLGLRKPNNKIVVAGDPLVMQQKIETATNCYPGRLVKKGTNDDDVVVNTAGGSPTGWLGYEQIGIGVPDDVDSIYPVNAQAPVLYGGKFVIVGHLASGENVAKDDLLVPAANGELKKASAIAVASGATQVTSSSANGAIVSGSIPTEGLPVAKAMESVNATSAAADIMVLSLI